MVWAAAIPAAFSLAGGVANLMQQGGQAGNQQQALMLALMNYQMQQEQMRKQYELATAGRTTARGDSVEYVPGRGWIEKLSPGSQTTMGRSDEVQREALLNQLTRGEAERSEGRTRRIAEGSAADPMLRAVMHGYGAPTREGVAGRNAIANVTQAGENADNVRRGYTAAALRTGSGTLPLQANMASINRGGTAGVRSALARSTAEADPLFNAQLQQFQQRNLGGYKNLTANAGDMPFQPETTSAGLSTLMDRAGMAAGAYGVRGMNPNPASAMAAYGNLRGPNYDTFLSGLGMNIAELLKKNKPQPYEGVPWNEDSRNPGAYNNWRF